MALLPSVPKDYNCGIFAYHDFKVFIAPTKPSIVYFTGLHRHGGTAPSPLPDTSPMDWAYRLSVICYPNRPTILGASRNPIAPFAGFDVIKKGSTDNETTRTELLNGVLKLPPEIRNRERYTFQSLYCADGITKHLSGQGLIRQLSCVMGQLCKAPLLSSPRSRERLL
jgi:hypothetical protein